MTNPNFCGLMDLFKRDKNLISESRAIAMITDAGYNRETLNDLIMCVTEKKGFCFDRYYKDMIEKTLYLIKSGVNIIDIMRVPNISKRDTFFKYSNDMEQLIKMNYPKGYCNSVVKKGLGIDDAKKLLDLRNEAIKHKKELSYPYCKINNREITMLIMDEPQQTLNLLKLIGHKSFVQSFHDKYDNVVHYLSKLEGIDENFPEYQRIMELTNPTESERYLKNVNEIKKLKQIFSDKNDKELIKKINNLTTINRQIVNNSIKDYREKLIFLQACKYCADTDKHFKINSLISSYIKPNKAKLQERAKIFNDVITIDNDDRRCTRLNFKKSKNLTNLINSDGYFLSNFKQLLYILNSRKNVSIAKIFDELPANIETQKQFKELGIDYKNWTKFNPKSYIEKEITLPNGQKAKIRVQKANMNDIEHSLFLGNFASCCTAVGSGSNQASAPNYIINKMISCIEVKIGKNDIGNTMCYIAEIDDKPALIIDNIGLQTEYRKNNEIRDAIIEYAQKMTKEIGNKDMSIYATTQGHDVDMDKFNAALKDFRLVGSNGEYKTYFDFECDFLEVTGNEIFEEDLYRIK